MRNAFATAIAGLVLSAPAWGQSRDIGMTAAAKNEVIVVAGADRRGLKIGDRVFQDQQIRTGQDSAAQLLFIDETALTVGPNSALVLDKAVFDPDKKVGELTVRAVSGAFRFVSGSSPSSNYTIKTPAGTIGVRGTWIDLFINGEIIHILVRRGAVVFCNDARQCLRVTAGYQIRANRAYISAPTKASHETLDSVLQLWFAGSPTELGQLAPGAGPPNDNPDQSGRNPFWWQTTQRDFQPDQSQQQQQLAGTPPPPGDGCNAACEQRLRQRATARLRHVLWGLIRFAREQDLSRQDRRFLRRQLLPEVRTLRQQIRNIDNRQEFREFRRDLREFRKDARKLIKCVDRRANNASCVGG